MDRKPTPEECAAVWKAIETGPSTFLEGDPISRGYLIAMTGLSDRTIRQAIHELVMAGKPIGSSPAGGYFLIRTREQAAEVANYLRGYAYELLDRARATERAFVESTTPQVKLL